VRDGHACYILLAARAFRGREKEISCTDDEEEDDEDGVVFFADIAARGTQALAVLFLFLLLLGAAVAGVRNRSHLYVRVTRCGEPTRQMAHYMEDYLEVENENGERGEAEGASQNDELDLEGQKRSPHERADRTDALPKLKVSKGRLCMHQVFTGDVG
jgi:hypothetical protein